MKLKRYEIKSVQLLNITDSFPHFDVLSKSHHENREKFANKVSNFQKIVQNVSTKNGGALIRPKHIWADLLVMKNRGSFTINYLFSEEDCHSIYYWIIKIGAVIISVEKRWRCFSVDVCDTCNDWIAHYAIQVLKDWYSNKPFPLIPLSSNICKYNRNNLHLLLHRLFKYMNLFDSTKFNNNNVHRVQHLRKQIEDFTHIAWSFNSEYRLYLRFSPKYWIGRWFNSCHNNNRWQAILSSDLLHRCYSLGWFLTGSRSSIDNFETKPDI